ncbi:MAG: hypothetical protein AAFU85_27920 [Planctomycetota bacterium]
MEELSELIRTVTEGNETIFDVVESIGDGKRLEISRRSAQPHEPVFVDPPVAPAQARCHTFHSIDHFAGYLDREAETDKCVVLADVEAGVIAAVLDEGDEKDREQITFIAKQHPLFRPWAKLIGGCHDVREFSLFAMQYRNAINEPDGRELALMFSQIKAAKSVTQHVGIGPKAINGVVIEMQIGSEKHEEPVELPESITIDVPLFLDTDPIQIQLDLLVTDRDGKIVVFVTAPKMEQHRFDVFQGMIERVRSGIPDVLVGLGSIDHREYRTLKKA